MSADHFGAFVVQHRYRVDPAHRERLLEILAAVREHALALGLAGFEAWQDDEDSWQFTEVHAFDSWNHYRRVAAIPASTDMRPVYDELERLIEGGWRGVETRTWNALDLARP
jgi:quinol monooxygenase YgiN